MAYVLWWIFIKKQLAIMMNKQTNQENFLSNASPPWQKFTGRIIQKEKKKVYNKKSNFKGNKYFKLQIVDEENQTKFIFVYPNLVEKETFKEVARSVHINKWWNFFCHPKGTRWILDHWQELTQPKPFFNRYE